MWVLILSFTALEAVHLCDVPVYFPSPIVLVHSTSGNLALVQMNFDEKAAIEISQNDHTTHLIPQTQFQDPKGIYMRLYYSYLVIFQLYP